MECWEEPSGHCPIQSRQTLPWNLVLHNPPFSFADNCCILRCVYSSAAHGIMCARHCSQSDWYDAQSPSVSIDYCSCEVRFNTRYVIHSECNSYFFLGIHVYFGIKLLCSTRHIWAGWSLKFCRKCLSLQRESKTRCICDYTGFSKFFQNRINT